METNSIPFTFNTLCSALLCFLKTLLPGVTFQALVKSFEYTISTSLPVTEHCYLIKFQVVSFYKKLCGGLSIDGMNSTLLQDKINDLQVTGLICLIRVISIKIIKHFLS